MSTTSEPHTIHHSLQQRYLYHLGYDMLLWFPLVSLGPTNSISCLPSQIYQGNARRRGSERCDKSSLAELYKKRSNNAHGLLDFKPIYNGKFALVTDEGISVFAQKNGPVHIYVDNQTLYHCLLKGSSSNSYVNKTLIKIWRLLERLQRRVVRTWIPYEDNPVDYFSRVQYCGFHPKELLESVSNEYGYKSVKTLKHMPK
ncbi:hypothetical protein BCR41DRAFT_388333 [Lobosporangium transversale]|uniref:Uncharacterized protein n=1 Tax=Lobosporangium transversale TaxID=64571 RepID=A0A1Y2GHN0_9FUNG|nr:hypothetical protein BCR41DRAFT_388333 [Lobosporangium transversale]ORZ09376.1 hypothetical protein BCR41DRAFT_388333 [Lobosporangium transversale]|eukprot:XP_021878829.1 hypothetical protein BCR41DRAFT_388333 [Lobosporangium transversale]